MDITKFYELRTRLYNTAAAGCMTVSEDFRLKRAVEDFKPLAAANKAFEKLYALCEKLLSAEKPEDVLPDCIALAEALAVTQGTFADNAETTPAEGTLTPIKNASDLKAVMSKSSPALWKLSAENRAALGDPRTIFTFLHELETGKFNDNFKVFCEIMCDICGRALVPGLKATVKESGRQLQYIAKLAGVEENEFFRKLATAKKIPEKVRLAAVSALSCSLENGELLAELFNTGSAKVKSAALLAMAEMDAPEAEPIFEKLFEDFKKNRKTLKDAIFVSSGKACSEFVRKFLLQLKHDAEHSKNKETQFDAKLELASGMDWMLENKSELDDVFLALEADRECEGTSKANCNEVLMKGLSGKNGDAVRAQIERLYAKEPKTFRMAKAFSDFLADTDKKPDFSHKDDYDCTDILAAANYVPLLDGYYLEHFYTENIDIFPLLRFCKKFPEWVFQYIRDTADEAVKLFNDLQAPTRDEMVKKAKALGFEGTNSTDALDTAFLEVSYIVDPLACHLRDHLVNCAPEDLEPLKQAMTYMARKSVPVAGGYNFTKTIIDFLPEITPQEHADMLVDYTVNRMVMRNFGELYPVLNTLSGQLTKNEMLAALEKLKARVLEWSGKIDDKVIKKELKAIDDCVGNTQSKG